MTLIVRGFMLLLVCAQCMWGAAQQGAPEVAKSLVYIYWPGETEFGPAYLGTGFFVSAQGSVMTASHVVSGTSCTVQFEGRTMGSFAARVTRRDEARDIALLEPVAKLRERVEPLEISPVRLRAERTYYAPILFSLDRGWPEFHASIFRAWCVAARDGFLYLDAKLPGGASGGPILDGEGRVCAVVVSTRAYPMQLGNPVNEDATSAGVRLSAEDRLFFLLKGSVVSPAELKAVRNQDDPLRRRRPALRGNKR